MRTTLALALRGARCSLWRSRSASVAWPWQAPARLSARVHECKGANRQKVFFVVVSCRVLWWVVRDHHALILIGAWCCRFAIYELFFHVNFWFIFRSVLCSWADKGFFLLRPSSPYPNRGTMLQICNISYFIFLYFVWVNYCFCFDMPAKELSTLIRLSRANYSLNFPCFANAVAKVWYTFVECRQWRGCENPFLCPAFLFPWFCQSKT